IANMKSKMPGMMPGMLQSTPDLIQSHSQPLQPHQETVVKTEGVYLQTTSHPSVAMPPPLHHHPMAYGNLAQNPPLAHSGHSALLAAASSSGAIKRRPSTSGITSSPSPLMENAMVNNSSNGMGTPVPSFATIPGQNMQQQQQTSRDPSAETHPGPSSILGSTAPSPSPSLSSAAIAINPGTPTGGSHKNAKKARHSSVTSLTSPSSATPKTLATGNAPTTSGRNRKSSGKKDSANKKKDSMVEDGGGADPTAQIVVTTSTSSTTTTTTTTTPKDLAASSSAVTLNHVGNIGSPGMSVHQQAAIAADLAAVRVANRKKSPLPATSPALASAVVSGNNDLNNNATTATTITQDVNPVTFVTGPDFTNSSRHGFENMTSNYYASTTPHQAMLNSTDGIGNNTAENEWAATLEGLEFMNWDTHDGETSSGPMQSSSFLSSMGVNGTTV
ncbi:hypothetical protein BGZ65_002783, partial [Modicella reniformis]